MYVCSEYHRARGVLSWETRWGFQGTGMGAHTDEQGENKILLKAKQNSKQISWRPINAAAQVAAFSKYI